MSKIIEIVGQKNQLFVDWLLHTVCNYKCHYCAENTGRHPFPDLGTCSTIVDKLVAAYPGKLFKFQLSGGEPTVWKELPEFIDMLFKKTNGSVEIITNGSVPASYWNKISKLESTSVFFSFHYTEVKDIDKFIDGIISCKARYKKILLMIPQYFDELCRIHTIFKDRIPGIHITCKPVDNRNSAPQDTLLIYSDAQKKHMQELNNNNNNTMKNIKIITDDNAFVNPDVFNIIITNQNKFYGWQCDIGLEKISLDFNGAIRRASCDRKYTLGDWRTGVFSIIPQDSIICDKSGCFCASEITTSKRMIQ